MLPHTMPRIIASNIKFLTQRLNCLSSHMLSPIVKHLSLIDFCLNSLHKSPYSPTLFHRFALIDELYTSANATLNLKKFIRFSYTSLPSTAASSSCFERQWQQATRQGWGGQRLLHSIAPHCSWAASARTGNDIMGANADHKGAHPLECVYEECKHVRYTYMP